MTELEKLAAALGYVPYTGGQGPAQEQAVGNNHALQRVVESELGRRLSIVNTEYGTVLQANSVTSITYDRYGFSDNWGELDQASITETVEFIRNLK